MCYYEIDPKKKYNIPKDISIINYKDKILVIASSTANWIVLESVSQLEVFYYLKKNHTINEALANVQFNECDVTFVVTQIEARKFCTKKVHDATDDERGLHLYLTNSCNLFCPHCYMFSGKALENELTTEEIISLFNDYKQIAHGTRVTLSGGEPTIRPDFDLIVEKASDMCLKVKILTNGALLTSKRISDLAKYISSVQISIDGYSEKSNSFIRGKGHFEKALQAIDTFIEYGVEVSVAITPPFDILQNHVDEYVSFANDLSRKYINKHFRVKFAEGLSPGRSVNLSKHQNDEYACIVKNIQHQIYGEDYDLMEFVETMKGNIILDNCMFGIFTVASNGDVYFCPEIGALTSVANIRTSSFNEIYENSLKAENATSINKLKPCKECCLRYICGGGCRIKYFPDLVNRKSFDNIDFNSIPSRMCNSKIKEKFYDLMIRSNEYLYSSF